MQAFTSRISLRATRRKSSTNAMKDLSASASRRASSAVHALSGDELDVCRLDLKAWLRDGFNLHVKLEPGLADLRSGVALCQLAAAIEILHTQVMLAEEQPWQSQMIKCNEKATVGSFFAKDNINRFLAWCARYVEDAFLFKLEDLNGQPEGDEPVLRCLALLARAQRGASSSLALAEEQIFAGNYQPDEQQLAELLRPTLLAAGLELDSYLGIGQFKLKNDPRLFYAVKIDETAVVSSQAMPFTWTTIESFVGAGKKSRGSVARILDSLRSTKHGKNRSRPTSMALSSASSTLEETVASPQSTTSPQNAVSESPTSGGLVTRKHRPLPLPKGRQESESRSARASMAFSFRPQSVAEALASPLLNETPLTAEPTPRSSFSSSVPTPSLSTRASNADVTTKLAGLPLPRKITRHQTSEEGRIEGSAETETRRKSASTTFASRRASAASQPLTSPKLMSISETTSPKAVMSLTKTTQDVRMEQKQTTYTLSSVVEQTTISNKSDQETQPAADIKLDHLAETLAAIVNNAVGKQAEPEAHNGLAAEAVESPKVDMSVPAQKQSSPSKIELASKPPSYQSVEKMVLAESQTQMTNTNFLNPLAPRNSTAPDQPESPTMAVITTTTSRHMPAHTVVRDEGRPGVARRSSETLDSMSAMKRSGYLELRRTAPTVLPRPKRFSTSNSWKPAETRLHADTMRKNSASTQLEPQSSGSPDSHQEAQDNTTRDKDHHVSTAHSNNGTCGHPPDSKTDSNNPGLLPTEATSVEETVKAEPLDSSSKQSIPENVLTFSQEEFDRRLHEFAEEKLHKQARAYQEQITRLEYERDHLQRKMESLEEAAEDVEANYDKQLQAMSKQRDDAKKLANMLQDTAADLRMQLADCKNEHAEQVARLEAELDKLKAIACEANAHGPSENNETQTSMNQDLAVVQQLEHALSTAQQEFHAEKAASGHRVASLSAQMYSLQQENNDLQEEVAQIKASQQQAIDKIVALAGLAIDLKDLFVPTS
eukprot:m.199324 g.199324  ORF g.199324 m.199324 type:complete len:1001 (-) comp16842_c0_seq1:115-3117(-)